MSEILVEDGSSWPASITVPEDGDARNSASVVVGFQGLANRSAYLKALLEVLLVLRDGGSLTSTDSVTWNIPNGEKLIFTAPGGGGEVDLTGVYHMLVNQNVKGPLFATGSSGRANRRPAISSVNPGITDIDPINYDTHIITPTAGACSVRLMPGITPVAGDWCSIINPSTSFDLVVLNPASGALLRSVDMLRSVAGKFQEATFMFDGAAWGVVSATPFLSA
jgi:hypothetical protein